MLGAREMVVFLTAIGFVTSLWWFVSRDVYGTSVFHNFFGVTVALAWPGVAWIARQRAKPPQS